MLPRSLQGLLRERLLIWSCTLLFIAALFAAVELLHAARLQQFLLDIGRTAKAIAAGDAEAPAALGALNGALETHREVTARNKLLLSLLLAFALGIFGVLEFRWLVRPIARMSAELAQDAGRLPSIEASAMRRDDIGILARALLVRQRSADARDADSQRQILDLDAQVAAQSAYQAAGAAFQTRIGDILESLAAQAATMAEGSTKLSGLSGDLDARAGDVSGATVSISDSVGEMARVVGAFAAAIDGVSRETARTAEAASEVRSIVQAANGDTQALREAVGMIGQMVALIGDVATKTNLLALNATIEAARVGEHGRGFAVVASEVKQLAQRTSQATSDATRRLAAVTSAAERIGSRVAGLVELAGTVDGSAAEIAGLMRAQGDTSQRISAGTSEAAQTLRSVSESMGQVTRMVGATNGAAGALAASSGEIGRQAEKLRAAVDDFLRAKNLGIADLGIGDLGTTHPRADDRSAA